MKTTAYLYKWIHIPTGQWYVGSKSSPGCHPDAHEKYICSSRIVKPMVKENRADWTYIILAIGDPAYIRRAETLYLRRIDAKNDPTSFNRSNAGWDAGNRLGVKESDQTRMRKSIARRGEKNPMWGKKGESCPHYGKKHSDQRKSNISKSLTGHVKSDEHRKNISDALKGNPKVGMKGERNPQYGKPASEASKIASKLKNSGENNPMRRPENQKVCENCNRTVAKNHYTLFHGPKCKSIKVCELAQI
jgi:hypothetical protein